MQSPRHQFFTGAAFTLDEYGALRGGQAFQQGKHALHGSALTQELTKAVAFFDRLPQLAVFVPQIPFC